MHAQHKALAWMAGVPKSPPLSHSARIEAGYLLRLLQSGQNLSLPHSRPMPSIGKRCHELRITDEDVTWRFFYRIDMDCIVLIHWEQKKTRSTLKATIELCKARLAAYDDRIPEGVMEEKRKKKLQSKGWVVGDVDEFLDLDQADLAIIDMKLALAGTIVEKRKARKMTQAKLAESIGSSQSRIAKVEHGDPSVSLELMMRALISLGSSRQEIGRALG